MKKIILAMLFLFVLFSNNIFAENKTFWSLNCEVINKYKLDINSYPNNILIKDNFSKQLIIYWHNSVEDSEWYIFYNDWKIKTNSFNKSSDEYYKINWEFNWEKSRNNYFIKRDIILKNNNFEYNYENRTKLLMDYNWIERK
jgi:hypothetical protein